MDLKLKMGVLEKFDGPRTYKISCSSAVGNDVPEIPDQPVEFFHLFYRILREKLALEPQRLLIFLRYIIFV